MRQDREEWLKEKIEQDLEAIADEREKLLAEMEELQDIEMPMEKLDEIHREIERRKHARLRGRIRPGAFLVAAAAMVLVIGVGMVSTGNKLYIPEIFQRTEGDEVTTKVNNADAVASQYDEEEVCREIEDKLGVIPIRFLYQPEGMVLAEYWVSEEEKEAIMVYEYDGNHIYIYVSKDYNNSAVNFEVDGSMLDSITVNSCGFEVPVYEYEDSEGNLPYAASFEYLNTYYSISGMINLEEFEKIVENILIKNV